MLKKYLIIAFCFAILSVLISSWLVPVKHTQKPALQTIIIDAGHGLPDPGAQGEYSNESDLTLAIALRLGKKLEAALPDCKIIYTRTDRYLPNNMDDKDLANRYRAKMANENHGDLFVAIHVNDAQHPYSKKITGYRKEKYYTYTGKGSSKKKVAKTRTVPIVKYYKLPGIVKGTETYIWASDRNEAKQKFVKDNEQEMYGEKVDSTFQYFESPEAKILASLRTQKYFANSKMVADFIQEEFEKAGRVNLGVKQRDWEGIWVLQATAMPSILVETGFICTPSEENYLNSEIGQEEISDCVLRAILKYKIKLETLSTDPQASADKNGNK